jgi:hypothetical protein
VTVKEIIMKAIDLKETLADIPDDAEVVISNSFVIDEKDNITCILDIPVVGIGLNTESDPVELRFVLKNDAVEKCFEDKDFKPLDF